MVADAGGDEAGEAVGGAAEAFAAEPGHAATPVAGDLGLHEGGGGGAAVGDVVDEDGDFETVYGSHGFSSPFGERSGGILGGNGGCGRARRSAI